MTYQQSQLVDQYIAQFDGDTKERLLFIRGAIQATFPKTIEDISYGIPTYRPAPKRRGVVHFAAHKDHIGIYGILPPKSNAVMHTLMDPYRTGQGTIAFKNSGPLPKGVIRQILAWHATKVNKQ